MRNGSWTCRPFITRCVETTSPLLFQVDVLPAIVGAVRSVQKARYEAAERRIHAEVSAEHAQFCEANDCSQINEGLVLPKRTP